MSYPSANTRSQRTAQRHGDIGRLGQQIRGVSQRGRFGAVACRCLHAEHLSAVGVSLFNGPSWLSRVWFALLIVDGLSADHASFFVVRVLPVLIPVARNVMFSVAVLFYFQKTVVIDTPYFYLQQKKILKQELDGIPCVYAVVNVK